MVITDSISQRAFGKCFVQKNPKTAPLIVCLMLSVLRALDYPCDEKLEGISKQPGSGEKQALMLYFGEGDTVKWFDYQVSDIVRLSVWAAVGRLPGLVLWS
jgi:hypothetical protein